ncbi:MAG: hypothetical protein AAB343_03230 [Patescibacteria group bacterium]
MKEKPSHPTVQDVANLQTDFALWVDRINPPEKYQKGFRHILRSLWTIMGSEYGYSPNELRELIPDTPLPPRSTKAFMLLWSYYHSDWFKSPPPPRLLSNEDDE